MPSGSGTPISGTTESAEISRIGIIIALLERDLLSLRIGFSYLHMKFPPLKHLLHYIPIAIVAFFILLNYADPFIGLWAAIASFWIIVAVLVWLVFALIRSWKIGGVHRNVVFCTFGLEILALVMFFLIRVPAYKCDPDEMVMHYEKNRTGMEELISYIESALNDGQQMCLEFEHGKISMFHTSTMSHWDVDKELKYEIMSELGLDNEEFNSIKSQLSSIHCISVDTHFPAYCDIGYKRVGMGMYSYRLYLNPMSDEEKEEALLDGHYIPYNETTLLMFGGGAAGPDTFSHKVKDDFLRRHPFPSSNTSK